MEVKYIVCIPTTIRQWSERKEQHEAKTQIKNEAKNSSAHGEREREITGTVPPSCCHGQAW